MLEITSGAWVAGLVSGVVVYALNKFADRFLVAPRLRIVAKAYHASNSKCIIENNSFIRRLQLSVINESTYVAKNCKVFLLRWAVPLLGPMRIESQDGCMQLGWTIYRENDRFGNVDLPKGLSAGFELIATLAHDTSWMPSKDGKTVVPENAEREYKIQWQDVILRGRSEDRVIPLFYGSDSHYSLNLVATADNAEPYFMNIDVCIEFVNSKPVFRIILSKGKYDSRLLNFFDSIGSDVEYEEQKDQ